MSLALSPGESTFELVLVYPTLHHLILLYPMDAAALLRLQGADGSAYLEMGQTKVIAIVKGPREVTRR